jgi:hypothetical protein
MIGSFMMDEREGSGDGECGNGMDWIGNPVRGGWVDPTPASTVEEAAC